MIGDQASIEETASGMRDVRVRGVDVLHCDDFIIVLNKPAGLLTQPGLGPRNQDCLSTRVAAALPGALIVHRLDMETSGVIVMARDPETHRRLSRQFHDRMVEKRYIAIVHGSPDADDGEIDLPLRKDIDDRPRSIVDHVHGKSSQTRWRVVDRLRDCTRLDLRPTTGRSHQLRVHLAAVGHAILGDSLYAPPSVRSLSSRLMLHAMSLSFTHPARGEATVFETACPF